MSYTCSNPGVHLLDDGCMFMYGTICLHAAVQGVFGFEDKAAYIAACQQIIPYLYIQPSS